LLISVNKARLHTTNETCESADVFGAMSSGGKTLLAKSLALAAFAVSVAALEELAAEGG